MKSNPNISILCRIRPYPQEKCCIVPYPDSKSIIASHSPLQQLRSSDIKDPVKLNVLRSTLLEDSQMIKFDAVINAECSQAKIFSDWVENSVIQMIAGRNLCVITCGISGSGKSYTMRGEEGNNRGILIRSAESLLQQINQNNLYCQIKFSAIVLCGDHMADLMEGNEVSLSSIGDLYSCLRAAIHNRNSYADKENKVKIHFIVTLKLYQGDQFISRADFLEFAGSEYVKEDKSIARALNSISNTLTNNKENIRDNALISYLQPSLNIYTPSSSSQVILICCALPSPRYYKESLPILKFVSRIKECIDEKTRKYEDISDKKEIEKLVARTILLEKEKIDIESRYNEEIKVINLKNFEEKEKLLNQIKQLRISADKKPLFDNESTNFCSEIINFDEINPSFKKIFDSKIDESPIRNESPHKRQIEREPRITSKKSKEIKELRQQVERQNYLLKEKDKFIEEMKSIHSSPDFNTKRRPASVERASEVDSLKKLLKSNEESYAKKYNALTSQLVKYQEITKELNIELQAIRKEKSELTKELQYFHDNFQMLEEKYSKLNEHRENNEENHSFIALCESNLDDILSAVRNLIEFVRKCECDDKENLEIFVRRYEAIKLSVKNEINDKENFIDGIKKDRIENFPKATKINTVISSIIDILFDIESKLSNEKEARKSISLQLEKSNQNYPDNQIKNLEFTYLMNQFGNSLKENRIKEDHIQKLLGNLNAQENEIHNLKNLASSYEDLMSELRNSYSEIKIKLQENVAKISKLKDDNKIMKRKLGNLEDERDITDKEIYKRKIANDEIEIESDTIAAKMENLQIRLSDAILNNNHLLIEKSELKEQIDQLQKPYRRYKNRIDKIQGYILNLERMHTSSAAEYENLIDEVIG